MSAAQILRLCRGCRAELATIDGLVIAHDRWDAGTGRHVPCSGSGRKPRYAPVATVKTKGLLL